MKRHLLLVSLGLLVTATITVVAVRSERSRPGASMIDRAAFQYRLPDDYLGPAWVQLHATDSTPRSILIQWGQRQRRIAGVTGSVPYVFTKTYYEQPDTEGAPVRVFVEPPASVVFGWGRASAAAVDISGDWVDAVADDTIVAASETLTDRTVTYVRSWVGERHPRAAFQATCPGSEPCEVYVQWGPWHRNLIVSRRAEYVVGASDLPQDVGSAPFIVRADPSVAVHLDSGVPLGALRVVDGWSSG